MSKGNDGSTAGRVKEDDQPDHHQIEDMIDRPNRSLDSLKSKRNILVL